MSFDSTINRRDFLKKAVVAATGATVLTYVGITIAPTLLDQTRTLDNPFDRSIGEGTTMVPSDWVDALPKVRIGPRELTKDDIDSITADSTSVPYNRACNCDGKFNLTVKTGMYLGDVYKKLGLPYTGKELTQIDSPDLYTLVNKNDNVYVTIAYENLPKKLRNQNQKGLEIAKQLQMTPTGIFLPYRKGGGAAWMDLADVSNIFVLDKDIKPGTYFRLPNGEFAQAKRYDGTLYQYNYGINLLFEGEPLKKLEYSGPIKTLAENNVVKYEKKGKKRKAAFIPTEEILKQVGIENTDNIVLRIDADNYVAMIRGSHLQGSGMAIDDANIPKYGSPGQFMGPHIKQAASVKGVREIDILTMYT